MGWQTKIEKEPDYYLSLVLKHLNSLKINIVCLFINFWI